LPLQRPIDILNYVIMSSYTAHIEGLPATRATLGRIRPWAIFSIAWSNRGLIYQLARREIEARYRGSMLGIVWSLLVPLMMLGVYTMFFGGLLHSHWNIPPGGKGYFFLILFMGLIILNFFGDCVGRAPGLMLANVSYIKRVVFPIEILAFVSVLSALFDMVLSTSILVVIFIVMLGLPGQSALLLPVTIAPIILVTLGMIWFLSSLGVYLRDLRQVIGVVLAALPFLCPLFFPPEIFERLGPVFSKVIYLNPITVPVMQSRQVLFFNQIPNWHLWCVYTICSYIFACLGLIWFSYSQRGFADVV
jgi:lipopolysaccharide transport system permease protein